VTRFSYQELLALVDGDGELIELLVEEGEIQRSGDDVALVDVDRVLVARTLLRDLEVNWPGAEVILQLREHLADARRRIAALEAEIGNKKP
jgi:hypothetical protein